MPLIAGRVGWTAPLPREQPVRRFAGLQGSLTALDTGEPAEQRETQTEATAHWLAVILRGLRFHPCGCTTLPSRIFSLAAVKSIEITSQTLLTFAPSFPTRPDLATQLLSEWGCLSWGFPKMPLRRLSSGSPLPGTVHEHARSRFPSGEERQLSSMFRPHGFSPSRRVPPPSDSALTLTSHPDRRADAACMFQHASDPGVHRVSVAPSRLRLFRAFGVIRPHPRDAFLPFEAFSLNTAAVSGRDRRGVTTSSPREDITILVSRLTAICIAGCTLPSLPSHRCPPSELEELPLRLQRGRSISGRSSMSRFAAVRSVARAAGPLLPWACTILLSPAPPPVSQVPCA